MHVIAWKWGRGVKTAGALCLITLLAAAPGASLAQSADDTESTEVASEVESEEANLLTQAELENLVAPVALYPDTLLIQILVAATNPLQVVKGDRLLATNEGAEPEVIEAAVDAEEWDESVAVLAKAFPDVIADMATHIEWTETVGDAMLAQSDDVMVAIQTMRTQAINSGALISGEEQTVEVTEEEEVIIQPASPEVVYVPQYDPQVVYAQNNSNVVGDAIVTGAIAFGTFALIDAIFDDDDDWNNYWGCRNCGGWGGGPIYPRPDIDIDVDGNVNIGNSLDLGDRPDRRPDGGWKADDNRKNEARNKISNKRDDAGKTKLPINKPQTRSDDLRNKLSAKSGAADISRPGGAASAAAVKKTLPKKQGVAKAANRTAKAKPAIKKPAAKKSPVRKATAPKKIAKKPKATHKRAAAPKAKAGSKRGGAGARKMKGRR